MKMKTLKIELSLSKTISKTKCMADLYGILNDLNINDEKDLISLNFAKDNKDDLVYKLITNFKSIENGELFYEHINKNISTYQFSNPTKNYIEAEENNYSDSSSSDSICLVDNNMESSYFNPSTETSYIDTTTSDTTIKESIQQSNLIDLKSDAFSQIEVENEPLELYSNIPIKLEDIEVIILFLENKQRSGGGDVSEFKLDEKNRILTVWFTKNSALERVLSKKTLKFKNYVFNLRRFKDKKEYELDMKTLVVKNFKTDDLDIIQMFAENLVSNDNEENEVQKVVQSKVFNKSIYYITFKLDFDYDQVEKRLARKPTLFGQKIELIKAQKTRSIVIKAFNQNEIIPCELIELHFTNKKRSGISSYEYLLEKDPFIIITLDSEETVSKCLEIKHEISKKELMLEYLYNFDLIEAEEVNIPVEIKNKSETQNMIQTTQESETLIEKQPIEEKFRLPTVLPSITFDLKKESNASVLEYWEKDQLKRLINELHDLDASISGTTDKNMLKIESTIKFEQLNLKSPIEYEKLVTNWENKIKNKIESFFSEFDTQKIIIRNPIKFMASTKYDKLRINLKKLDDKEMNSEYELVGFREQTANLIQLIKKSNDEIEKFENKEIITDEINGLKLHECRILFVNKYIKNLKDMFEDIKISIIAKSGIIKMEGTRTQIETAKKIANETLKSIITKLVPKKTLYLKFVQKKEKAVAQWLKDTPIPCVLEADIGKNLLIIYSTDKNVIDEFLSQERIKIQEREFELDLIENKQAIASIFKEIELDEEVIINDSDPTRKFLTICGFKERVEAIYHTLCDLT